MDGISLIFPAIIVLCICIPLLIIKFVIHERERKKRTA